MKHEMEYDKLLKDLRQHAETTSSTELERLVQKAVVSMALALKDSEDIPVCPLTTAHLRSDDLDAMPCKRV